MTVNIRRRLYSFELDSVINDREAVVITRSGHDPVVIVSLEDYESLRETAYLMRSPANARRLLNAMERLEAGQGQPHDLVDAVGIATVDERTGIRTESYDSRWLSTGLRQSADQHRRVDVTRGRRTGSGPPVRPLRRVT